MQAREERSVRRVEIERRCVGRMERLTSSSEASSRVDLGSSTGLGLISVLRDRGRVLGISGDVASKIGLTD